MALFEVFDLAGMRIRVAEAPPLMAESLAKAFSLSMRPSESWDVEMTGVFARDDAYTENMPAFLRARYDTLPPGGVPVVFSGPGGEIAVLDRGRESSSYALSSPPHDRFELVAHMPRKKTAPLIFQSVLVPILSELLLLRDKLLMHAACVASPSGKGLLFLGDSGDGKTTTAFTMVRQGCGLLSDDLVVACKTGDGAELVGIREKLNLTENTVRFFPELSRVLPGEFPSDGQKVPVDPRILLPGDRLVDKAPPSAVFILKKRRGGPMLVPSGGKPILDAILKGSTFARADAISPRRVSIIWALLDRARAFELITGLDPDALGRFLVETAEADFRKMSAVPDAGEGGEPPNAPRSPKPGTSPHPRGVALRTILEEVLDGAGGASSGADLLPLVSSDGFLRWSRHHRIHPLVLQWIVGRGDFPENRRYAQARAELANLAAAALEMAGWLRAVAVALEEAGVAPVAVRGPGMAAGYFPDPCLRSCRDLDFFVEAAALPASEEAVRRLGLELQGNRDAWIGKKELRYGNGRVVVELHWDLQDQFRGLAGGAVPDLPVVTETIHLDGLPLRVLSPTLLLLSSCLHFALEHKSDRIVRLVDLRQVTKVAGPALDWSFLVGRAEATGSRMAVGHTLFLARELAGAAVPDAVLERLEAGSLAEKLAARILPAERFLGDAGAFAAASRSVYGRIVSRPGGSRG